MLSLRSSIVALVWLLTVVCAGAQPSRIIPKNNSPYSRLGLGDALSQHYAAQAGMGGLSAAFHDPYHTNALNPASLAFLQATSFEVGLYAKYAALSDDQTNTGIWSGNLNYLSLAFPLINPINEALDRRKSPFGLGMMFALQPYTLVGYDIETVLPNDNEEIGTTTNVFKGTGGLYRLNWSSALRYKNFSGGVRLGYLFGKTSANARVEFDSLALAWATEFLDEISYRGLTWTAGVQYVYRFKKPDRNGELQPTGKSITVGAYGNSKTSFDTRTSLFYQRNNISVNISDTIAYDDDARGSGRLPSELTLGLVYEDANRLRLGADFSVGQWSGYENEARPESLLDTWRVAVGGEYIPDILSYNNYFERMRYRLGFFYGSDPRSVSGQQLKEYGLSLGIGMPLIMPRQQTSFINFAVEVGQFGLSDYLQETFVRMTLGFTLNDNTWFFKRKFN